MSSVDLRTVPRVPPESVDWRRLLFNDLRRQFLGPMEFEDHEISNGGAPIRWTTCKRGKFSLMASVGASDAELTEALGSCFGISGGHSCGDVHAWVGYRGGANPLYEVEVSMTDWEGAYAASMPMRAQVVKLEGPRLLSVVRALFGIGDGVQGELF